MSDIMGSVSKQTVLF